MNTMSEYPAILIGGPPHSGKSILAYSLKRALKEMFPDTPIYLFRAAPDGEGDWFIETDQDIARSLRHKHAFTPAYARRIARATQRRQMPFLVDVGGKISAEQEVIARACTHAVLVSATPDGLAAWQTFAERMGLSILALLHSKPDGQEFMEDRAGILHGTVTRLERGSVRRSPLVDVLARRLHQILAPTTVDLRHRHRATSPDGLFLDVEMWPSGRWTPHMLKRLTTEIPGRTPVAVYGIAPNWVYAALALHAYPAPFYQFDAVLGWTTPVALQATNRPARFWTVTSSSTSVGLRLHLELVLPYIPKEDAEGEPVPQVLGDAVILDGKCPLWLWTGWARAYAHLPSVWAYQPQLGYVCIAARAKPHTIGTLVPA